MSEHWLQHAHGRIVAGDSEPDVLADYGWVQLTDEEREAVAAAARIIDNYEDEMDGFPSGASATLRKLLDRLHT